MIEIRIDDVPILMHILLTKNGMLPGKLRFSVNGATLWTVDEPFWYRLPGIDELTNPAICLACWRRSSTVEAIVPVNDVLVVLEGFSELRFADRKFYLVSGSLNIFNALVGLNFSCDGSHYKDHAEFLEKDMRYWTGPSCAS